MLPVFTHTDQSIIVWRGLDASNGGLTSGELFPVVNHHQNLMIKESNISGTEVLEGAYAIVVTCGSGYLDY